MSEVLDGNDVPPVRRERVIEEAVMAHPDRLGYPDALAVRSWRVAPEAGTLDIVLLPQDGEVELVLIEVKAAGSPDAASKVIGQLLMYYAGALQLGSEGLALLRTFATERSELARAKGPASPNRVAGISPRELAWERLRTGEPMRPEAIRLVIAIDDVPRRALLPTVSTLRELHGLEIDVVRVRENTFEYLLPHKRDDLAVGGRDHA